MKHIQSIIAGLALAAFSTPAWAIQVPVTGDTAGSPATNTIKKAAGTATTLPLSAKSQPTLFFDLSNTGITPGSVTGARLILYFSKVTKAGVITFGLPTTAFQETFPGATIPLPTNAPLTGSVPVTLSNNKGYVVIPGVQIVVQDWLTTPASNRGLAFIADANLNALLASREGAGVGAAAILEIDVSPTGALNASSVTSTGTVSGTTVTGTDLVSTTLTTSGAASAGSLTTTGNASVGGTLAVTGGITSGGLTINTGGADIAGAVSLGSLTVSGTVNAPNGYTASIIGGFSGGFANLSSNVTAGGNLRVGGTASRFAVNSAIDTTTTASITAANDSSNASILLIKRANGSSIANFTDPTSSGASLFLFGGVGAQPGGGSWASSSDRRLKKNIEPLNGALDRLMQLRSVTYEYRDPAAIHEPTGTQIGFIAQEVEPIFPAWVGEKADGMKFVAIKGFESLTVQALRELRSEKDAEIAALKASNADLAQKLSALEARDQAREARLTRLETQLTPPEPTARTVALTAADPQ